MTTKLDLSKWKEGEILREDKSNMPSDVECRVAAKNLGMCYKSIQNRIIRYGVPINDALTRASRAQYNYEKYNTTEDEVKEACGNLGCTQKFIFGRLQRAKKSGWSNERIFTEPVNANNSRHENFLKKKLKREDGADYSPQKGFLQWGDFKK